MVGNPAISTLPLSPFERLVSTIPQHLAGEHGVVGVGLVEIPDPVQQNGFRMLGLDA